MPGKARGGQGCEELRWQEEAGASRNGEPPRGRTKLGEHVSPPLPSPASFSPGEGPVTLPGKGLELKKTKKHPDHCCYN